MLLISLLRWPGSTNSSIPVHAMMMCRDFADKLGHLDGAGYGFHILWSCAMWGLGLLRRIQPYWCRGAVCGVITDQTNSGNLTPLWPYNDLFKTFDIQGIYTWIVCSMLMKKSLFLLTDSLKDHPTLLPSWTIFLFRSTVDKKYILHQKC